MSRSEAAQHIIGLEANNVLRLRAVRIEPSTGVVVIGGDNAAGKTSVLRAIEMALAGVPREITSPVRHGADGAEVVLRTSGGLVVTRQWDAGGTSKLRVTTADGAPVRAPQTMLRELLGERAVDPLEFARAAPKAQYETLRRLAGLDLSTIDAEYQMALEAERQARIRAQSTLARAAADPVHRHSANLPAEEISVDACVAALTAAETAARQRDARIAKRDAQREAGARQAGEVVRLERELRDARATLVRLREAYQALPPAGAEVDTTGPRERVRDVDRQNKAIRARQAAIAAQQESVAAQQEAKEQTARVHEARERRKAMIAAAKLPVDGLSIEDGKVAYRGVPLAQASGAERLRVSVAVALAGQPGLRILLIRDGSLLDTSGMADLAAIAAEYDAQVWVERVGDGDAGAIVIEDGAVRDSATRGGS